MFNIVQVSQLQYLCNATVQLLKKHETRKATMTQQHSIKALALQVLSRKHHAQQECNSKFHCMDSSFEQIVD